MSETKEIIPVLFTKDWLRNYLEFNGYSRKMADQLCEEYANNLQRAYAKGFNKGFVEGRQEPVIHRVETIEESNGIY